MKSDLIADHIHLTFFTNLSLIFIFKITLTTIYLINSSTLDHGTSRRHNKEIKLSKF